MRRTVLDAVRLAARRLFRVPALDRTLPPAGETFFRLDGIHAAAQGLASLSPTVLPAIAERQAEEQAALSQSVWGQRERSGGERTAAAAPAAAVLAGKQMEQQSLGTELERDAGRTVVEPPEKPVDQAVNRILLRDGRQTGDVETANRSKAIQAAAVHHTGIPEPAAMEANFAGRTAHAVLFPSDWRSPIVSAEVSPGTAERNGAIRPVKNRNVDHTISRARSLSVPADEKEGLTDTFPAARPEQNAAVSAWNRTAVVPALQANRLDGSLAQTTESMALRRQIAGTTEERTAQRPVIPAESVSLPDRTTSVLAFSTGTPRLVENAAAPSFVPTAQPATIGTGIQLPLPQPAGEDSLSSVPRPAAETQNASAAEPALRSSPAVRRKEPAQPPEEFWDQWARRFAGELYSSPEGVHG